MYIVYSIYSVGASVIYIRSRAIFVLKATSFLVLVDSYVKVRNCLNSNF